MLSSVLVRVSIGLIGLVGLGLGSVLGRVSPLDMKREYACVCVCIHVCLSACPRSKRKTVVAVNIKVGKDNYGSWQVLGTR